jgi:hypothetical protein
LLRSNIFNTGFVNAETDNSAESPFPSHISTAIMGVCITVLGFHVADSYARHLGFLSDVAIRFVATTTILVTGSAAPPGCLSLLDFVGWSEMIWLAANMAHFSDGWADLARRVLRSSTCAAGIRIQRRMPVALFGLNGRDTCMSAEDFFIGPGRLLASA